MKTPKRGSCSYKHLLLLRSLFRVLPSVAALSNLRNSLNMAQRNGYISLHDWCAELDADLTDESDDEEDEGELDPPEQSRISRPSVTASRPPETASRAPTRPTTQRATARSRTAARERDNNSSTYLNQPVQTSYTTSLFFGKTLSV